MNQPPATEQRASRSRGFKLRHVIFIMLAVMAITAGVTAWIIKSTFFAPPLEPVVLKQQEQAVLDQKLAVFTGGLKQQQSSPQDQSGAEGTLAPEKYSEDGLSRTVDLSERELNALLAKNTDLADKVALDLADDLISLRIRMPMDEDVPILGGKTLKVKAGAELAYENGRPRVVIKGVSIMGIPMPSAWLGGLKNVDLVEEFGGDDGFWKQFAAGVDGIRVTEGAVKIELKE